jgi:hypothetical protein
VEADSRSAAADQAGLNDGVLEPAAGDVPLVERPARRGAKHEVFGRETPSANARSLWSRRIAASAGVSTTSRIACGVFGSTRRDISLRFQRSSCFRTRKAPGRSADGCFLRARIGRDRNFGWASRSLANDDIARSVRHYLIHAGCLVPVRDEEQQRVRSRFLVVGVAYLKLYVA